MGTEYQPIQLVRTNIKIYCLGFADDMAVLTGDFIRPQKHIIHILKYIAERIHRFPNFFENWIHMTCIKHEPIYTLQKSL